MTAIRDNHEGAVLSSPAGLQTFKRGRVRLGGPDISTPSGSIPRPVRVGDRVRYSEDGPVGHLGGRRGSVAQAFQLDDGRHLGYVADVVFDGLGTKYAIPVRYLALLEREPASEVPPPEPHDDEHGRVVVPVVEPFQPGDRVVELYDLERPGVVLAREEWWDAVQAARWPDHVVVAFAHSRALVHCLNLRLDLEAEGAAVLDVGPVGALAVEPGVAR